MRNWLWSHSYCPDAVSIDMSLWLRKLAVAIVKGMTLTRSAKLARLIHSESRYYAERSALGSVHLRLLPDRFGRMMHLSCRRTIPVWRHYTRVAYITVFVRLPPHPLNARNCQGRLSKPRSKISHRFIDLIRQTQGTSYACPFGTVPHQTFKRKETRTANSTPPSLR